MNYHVRQKQNILKKESIQTQMIAIRNIGNLTLNMIQEVETDYTRDRKRNRKRKQRG
jgi:hypothetical protein